MELLFLFLMRRLVVLILALLPITALALDFAGHGRRYGDEPFSTPEAAGINLLTNVGVVRGNPDGTFQPRRTLNRAEFTKIILSLPLTKTEQGRIAKPVSSACFPDVQTSAWFAAPVCAAKSLQVIRGYDDGLFHPERPVTYAEALKMLSMLFSYQTPACGTEWFDAYLCAARTHGTLLPSSAAVQDPLTRGQMARLVAGFFAESQGELAAYRAAEQGKVLRSSSSSSAQSSLQSSSAQSSSVSSALSSSSSSLSPSSSSSSSASSVPDFPARSHLLQLGTRTEAIASASFFANMESAIVRIAKVKLKNKNDSIDAMYLVDRDGVQIGRLTLDSTDSTDLTWKGTFLGSGAYQIPKDTERTLGVELRLKPAETGGVPEKLIQVDAFTLSVEGVWSSNMYGSAGVTFSFPKHQTVRGKITEIRNVLDTNGILTPGQNHLLGSFSFSGSLISGAQPQVESLEFTINKSGVAVTNWQLGTRDSGERIPCSVNDNVVSCLSLPVEMASFGPTPRILELYGDVTIDQGARNPFLEADLNDPGTIGTNGAVRWTDGTGHYTWLEMEGMPLARGTKWQG